MAPYQQVTEVFPSKEEIAAGKLNDANIRLVLEGMHSDGIILLRDIVDHAHLDALNVQMVKEAKLGVAAGVKMNQGAQNIQQAPPFVPSQVFFDDIYCNKIVLHAVKTYLGEGSKWNLVTGNTALPHSTERQPVHSDADFRHPDCPFYCVANIPLITSKVATGATEIWLGGQHRGNVQDRGDGIMSIRQDLLDARRAIQPPVQPTVPKGSIILRDLRLWHAGMPNPSDQYRCMIALGFAAPWYHAYSRFRVPAGTGIAKRIDGSLKGTGVLANYSEVSEEEYARSRFAFDFTFKEEEDASHIQDDVERTAGMMAMNVVIQPNNMIAGLPTATNGVRVNG